MLLNAPELGKVMSCSPTVVSTSVSGQRNWIKARLMCSSLLSMLFLTPYWPAPWPQVMLPYSVYSSPITFSLYTKRSWVRMRCWSVKVSL